MEVVRINLGKSSHNMGTVVDFAGSERDSVAFWYYSGILKTLEEITNY